MKNYIYVKECLGKDGKPINIYKFRTMELGADKRLDEIVNGSFDSHGHPITDPRVTPLGRFLRKYWIDELPQLYNLARGDIKLVGIRSMREIDWDRYPRDLMERSLRQKPGLMAIQYAYPITKSFDDNLRYMGEYLDLWESDPLGTDDMYLSRIVRNIIFGGVRSS